MSEKSKHPHIELAKSIVRKLQDSGHTAYFAGGCVRDFVMKQTPTDYDIATTAAPEVIEKLFEKTVPVGKQFGVMLVLIENIPFEVATFRTEGTYQDGRHPSSIGFTTPEQDAKRRDFTINGLFFDPVKNQVIDYVNGQTDIKNKVVRTIGDPVVRFQEDKLRLLRGVRFAANLGFTIEEKTWNTIKNMASEIQIVSKERVREELVKLFTRKNSGNGLEVLSETGLLKEILPEVEAMKGIKQPADFHPEGDVFVHTKMLMNRLENPSLVLAFGALFHDIGKPVTYTNEGGKIRFPSHARIGTEMTKKILKRLRFSNKETDLISSCVDHHMTFADAKRMRVGKLKQFINRPGFLDELELHRWDCETSHGMLENYFFLKEKLVEYEKENLKPKPLINGNDLIDIGVTPGPMMKKILEQVRLMQLEGKWKCKDEALKWVRQKYLLPKAT